MWWRCRRWHAEFHTNFSVLTWVSTGPLLAFGLAAPLAGRVGDLFGHRRLYLWGLVGAMLSAVLTATAPDVTVLIFARVLDGVQGAATGTASMAMILRMFAPEDRVKAMGWWSMVGAGGPVIGVTLGAPIIQFFGWRALFWGQLVLLVLSTVVVALVLPAHGTPGGGRARPGAPRAVGRVSTGSARGACRARWWGHAGAQRGTGGRLVLAGGAGLGRTVGRVRRWCSCSASATPGAPLIPPEYFRRRNFMLPMGTRAFSFFAYFGGFFLFPLMMEQVYHYSETQVGLLSIARPLLFSISSPVAGYLTVRIGERTGAVLGARFVTLSMVLFAIARGDPLAAGGARWRCACRGWGWEWPAPRPRPPRPTRWIPRSSG